MTGVGLAYADEISDPYLDEYEVLLRKHDKLVGELVQNIIFYHAGLGGVIIVTGVVVFPYNPVVGGVLVVGGFALEAKGALEFADWAKRYGAILNEIKDSQGEY